MTFLWQQCVFANTSYLHFSQPPSKVVRKPFLPLFVVQQVDTPTNTRIHDFTDVTTGKRQKWHSIQIKTQLQAAYTLYFTAVTTLFVEEANQYYQQYLDTLHSRPSPVPDITKSQRLFSIIKWDMTQGQLEGLPQCE
jgi:hypothetical protein